VDTDAGRTAEIIHAEAMLQFHVQLTLYLKEHRRFQMGKNFFLHVKLVNF
jgi:hypothetical protein